MSALLGRETRTPFPRLGNRPPHHRAKARQVGLQYIVGGAAPERLDGGFLADGSGNEDKRRVRSAGTGELERPHSAETGNGEIRHDEVRRELGEPCKER